MYYKPRNYLCLLVLRISHVNSFSFLESSFGFIFMKPSNLKHKLKYLFESFHASILSHFLNTDTKYCLSPSFLFLA